MPGRGSGPSVSSRRSLRHPLYVQLVVSILAASVACAGGVFLVGDKLFGDLYRTSMEEAETRVASGTIVFNIMVRHVEQDARAAGSRALRELEKEFPSNAAMEAASTRLLRADADRLGVSEIYLIGPDGKIRRTSFDPDLGLDLYAMGPDVKNFLRGNERRDTISFQRLVASETTGQINSYYYLGPPGTDWQIEVSFRLRDMLPRFFSNMDQDRLLSLFFPLPGNDRGAGLYELKDIAFKSGDAYWSLFDEGHRVALDPSVLAEAASSGRATKISGGVDWIVKRLQLGNEGVEFERDSFLAVFERNMGPLFAYRLWCLVVAVVLSLLFSGLSFGRARDRFRRIVTDRIAGIENGLGRIGAGDLGCTVQCEGDDELARIALGINAMTSAISDRNLQLRELNLLLEDEVAAVASRERALASTLAEKDDLLREVHHRVRNNLQILQSLVEMEIEWTASSDGKNLLRTVCSHIANIAVANDCLDEESDKTKVVVDLFLSRLTDYLADLFAEGDRRMSVRVTSENIVVPADTAVILGLAVSEVMSVVHRSGSRDGPIDCSVTGDGASVRMVLGGVPVSGVQERAMRGLASKLIGLAKGEAFFSGEGDEGRWTVVIPISS